MLWQLLHFISRAFSHFLTTRCQVKQKPGSVPVIRPPTAHSKDSSGLECCDMTESYMELALITPHTGCKTFNPVLYHCDFLHWVHLQQALHRKRTEMCSLVLKPHGTISTLNMQHGKSLEMSCCVTQVLQIFE